MSIIVIIGGASLLVGASELLDKARDYAVEQLERRERRYMRKRTERREFV